MFECANRDYRDHEDEGKSIGAVSLQFIRSIAVNRGQTMHSARNRMLGHATLGLEGRAAS